MLIRMFYGCRTAEFPTPSVGAHSMLIRVDYGCRTRGDSDEPSIESFESHSHSHSHLLSAKSIKVPYQFLNYLYYGFIVGLCLTTFVLQHSEP